LAYNITSYHYTVYNTFFFLLFYLQRFLRLYCISMIYTTQHFSPAQQTNILCRPFVCFTRFFVRFLPLQRFITQRIYTHSYTNIIIPITRLPSRFVTLLLVSFHNILNGNAFMAPTVQLGNNFIKFLRRNFFRGVNIF